MKKDRKEPYKARSIRIEDFVWLELVKLKPRDKSWNLFIRELLDAIQYFKNL